MNRKSGKSKLKYVVIGVLAIGISALLIQIPGWREQWLYTFYENQQTLKAIKAANAINPFLSEEHTISNHILFQNYLTEAGAENRLVEQYELSVNDYPNSARVLAYYARVLPDAVKKQEIIDKAAEIDKDEQALLLVQTELALEQDRLDDAYWLSMKLHETNWYTHLLRAKVHDRLGNKEKAQADFAYATRCEGAESSVNLTYAQFLVENGIDAKSPFQNWTEDELIKEPMAYAYHTFLNHNDMKTVWNGLNSAVAYHPPALLVLSKAALNQNQPHIAGKFLDRAARFKPDDKDINIYWGLVALKEGKEELAESILMQGVLDEQTLTEDEHAHIGSLLWNAGQTKFAMKHFQHAGTKVPLLPGVSIELAQFYLDNDQCDSAIAIVKKNVWMFAESEEKAYAMAQKIEQCDNLDMAAELFGAILDHNAHYMPARDKLASIYVKQEEKDRAINIYDSYRKMKPDSGYCFVKAAEIHQHFGNDETAKQILDYVVQNPQVFADYEEIKPLIATLQNKPNKS